MNRLKPSFTRYAHSRIRTLFRVFCAAVVGTFCRVGVAAPPAGPTTEPAESPPSLAAPLRVEPFAAAAPAQAPALAHYGPFGWLDRRSQYGKGVFPEPFIVDDSDLEVNELRLDWLHTQGRGRVGNNVNAEVEKGFGLLTVEVEVPYDYDTSHAFDPALGHAVSGRTRGFDNVDVGVRHPVYQYVSPDESVDSTFGVALEVGVPTNSPLGKNAEIVPKVFNDLRLGEHFTLQSLIGYSFLRGSKPDGGTQSLEYGFVFGYTIPHEELPLPDVEQLIPVFEVQGETLMNAHQAGSSSVVGNAAVRVNLKAIGRVQPRLGFGYVFPIDKGARQDLRNGFIMSLVFDF